MSFSLKVKLLSENETAGHSILNPASQYSGWAHQGCRRELMSSPHLCQHRTLFFLEVFASLKRKMLTCCQLMMTSQGEVLDPFILLNGKRYIPFSVVLGLPHPSWWLSLPFPTDLSRLSYPLGSFIYTGICSWTVFFWIIDILMMTSTWILEAGFQQRLMEGKENTSKRHHSFSKGMLNAHRGIKYRVISDWVPGLAELTI